MGPKDQMVLRGQTESKDLKAPLGPRVNQVWMGQEDHVGHQEILVPLARSVLQDLRGKKDHRDNEGYLESLVSPENQEAKEPRV